ncbi:MAG: hypothetical protein IPM64_17595 [Phycisphaerales bacterium]|nr:hypothetical protein [Phycisphaerales bacterium]
MFTKPTIATTVDWPQQIGRLIDLAEGPALRNFIRNGDFQIAQRGASFAGITSAQYTLDGWKFQGSAGTNTITQETFTVGQTDVPGNPAKFLKIDRTSAAGAENVVIEHIIEAPSRLSGKTVTVSFWAKVASGTKALVFDLISFGVTPAIDTANNAASVTTTWTQFKATVSVPAMTAATSSAYVGVRLLESANFGTFTLSLADAQLELGSEATLFDRLNLDAQLAWNQRFFAKSFAMATTPAQNIGVALCEEMFTATKAGAVAQYGPFIAFPVRMRGIGTVTLYNTSAANAQVRDLDASADCSGSTSSSANERGFWPVVAGNASTAVGNRLTFNWTATAEL